MGTGGEGGMLWQTEPGFRNQTGCVPPLDNYIIKVSFLALAR